MSRPIRSLRRRTIATALATSVVLGMGTAAASAASAQTLTLRDAHHDVWSGAPGDQQGAGTPAPDETAADAYRVRLRHGPHNVVVVERFANLTRTGAGNAFTFRFRTNTGLERSVDVDAFRGSWRGKAWFTGDGVEPPACDGLGHRVDYARDLVTVTVPRSCLKDPRWVQLKAANAHITRSDGPDAPSKWFYDNPQNDKAYPSSWSARVRRG